MREACVSAEQHTACASQSAHLECEDCFVHLLDASETVVDALCGHSAAKHMGPNETERAQWSVEVARCEVVVLRFEVGFVHVHEHVISQSAYPVDRNAFRTASTAVTGAPVAGLVAPAP
eukprot:8844148-Pyramimonas_sp.AAC.1